MSRLSNLNNIFLHSQKKVFLKYNKLDDQFKIDDNNFFKVINGIPDFYIRDKGNVSITQSDFYDEVKFPNYDGIEDFNSLLVKSERSTFFKKLDEEIKMQSNILEVGCGTGQLSLFLSRFQRRIFAIDLAIKSLELGENFRKKNEIENVFFSRMNIFNLFFPDNFFDVIISNGVLHHTENPKLAFFELTKHLKKNGYIVIGLYHKYGRIYNRLTKFMINTFGNTFKILDKKTLDKNTSKEKRFAWFMDQYKNPKETSHTFLEIIEWFKETNIEFISSIPFSFPNNTLLNKKLFKKNKIDSKVSIFIKEFLQCLSFHQMKEGGFFIMIGKKRDN